ncbi:MAG: hypothetical protein FJ148_05710 [Deltaproteobacteria bacterium]|nr:hypothetical protein [Deltaproteobacteria bacterium]
MSAPAWPTAKDGTGRAFRLTSAPASPTTKGRRRAGRLHLTGRDVRSGFPVLPADGHAVYRLGPGLLLVFKPRGHIEEPHAHAYRQTLRVLRGALRVRTARGMRVLRPSSAALTLVAGRRHATEAIDDTWLVAESPRRR